MVYFLDCCQCNEVPVLVVFQYLHQLKGCYLKNSSGLYYSSHKKKVAQSVGALSEGATWPHDSFDQLGQILLGYMSKPFNLFYHFCQMKLYLLAFAGFVQSGIDQGSKDTLNGTDSISRELKKVMDIDSLINGVCKKCKTITGVVRIGFVSEEEENCAQLEHRSKMRVDSVGVVIVIARASSLSRFLLVSLPSAPPASSPIIIDKDNSLPVAHVSPSMPIIRETPIGGNRVDGLECKEVAERRNKEALQAELNVLTKEHVAETNRVIQEYQDQVASTIREQLRVLEDFKKKIASMYYVSRCLAKWFKVPDLGFGLKGRGFKSKETEALQ
ncbi:hypothetical protein J1N35_015110 [Gossypium stocksii]|uniref:Uncharacterized protein n=1 Tax=Gossypium stocksii TaxID=47602 RepID=A0A9D3VY44_9ROSI|nr:hypothetical protein J1N35_015110 [Gossypium stocksii]